MPRALISVSNKTGVVDFARALVARGYDIVSTGGTAKILKEAGIPVTGVSELTGVPEMLDGRVKTLHPAVHGGILARRGRADDLQALARHGIGLIDIVAVNLYPFVETAAKPGIAFESLVEEIDVGGPTLVRAAAKNFADVLAIVSPSDYAPALEEIGRPDGPRLAFRFDLARKAFAHTSAYDAAIAGTLQSVDVGRGAFTRQEPAFLPGWLLLGLSKIQDLRYGENPHQVAAWYATEPPGGLGAARVLQGKHLSYTNLLDLDAAVRMVIEFDEPAAVVVKHTNPCGAAVGATALDAYVRAREADRVAAFGGIVGLNRPIDEETARAIVATFIEVVIAPGVSDEARAVLAGKPNMRVVVMDLASARSGGGRPDVHTILGAALVQERDRVLEAARPWNETSAAEAGLRIVTRRAPTDDEWSALRFAWRICAHVKSNTVLFTTARETVAVGAGQTSRVDAVKVAVFKAGASGRLKGTVAASDGFFPFRDGLDEVAQAGATSVVQPGGSVRDQEVIASADEHGVAMVFTGRRHFRH